MTEDSSKQGAVVLLSGGMDSTVLLHHVAKEIGESPVYTLSFDYGQRHDRELDCARAQASEVGVAHHEVADLRFLGPMLNDASTLLRGGEEVPNLGDIAESDREQPPTYVPNRNMMLLSIAAAYAESRGARSVYYGAQAQDEYGYWDCTAEFLERINSVLALNRRDAITILAPFVGMKKEALVILGNRLDVDFSQTWSCYRGGAEPCGTCPTCVERAAAFASADVADPSLAE